MLPENAVDQFASTFKEWHYFAGGAAIGFVAGTVYGARMMLRRRVALVEARDDAES